MRLAHTVYEPDTIPAGLPRDFYPRRNSMRSLSLKSLGHLTAVLAAVYTGGACSDQPAATPAGTGGQAGSGGSATGGTTGSGGAASGGASGSGGVTGSGGSSASGGASGSGGVANSGGSSARGGTTGSGGAASGGASGSGGAAGSGGSSARGGTTGSGGAASGGTSGGGTAKGGAGGGPGGAGGTSVPTTLPPAEDFTDKVGSASVDMVYIPGGSFTLGCETGTCDPDTSPVENITVSPYHIMKTEAAKALWTAAGLTEGTWYDCMAFACELGKQTGHAYRMMTEAEFEYAAKKHLDKLSGISATEEWAFNSWETKYSCKPGDVDPLGPGPGAHTQKTRRDKATGDKITGRLIRSIDGIGPKCRLTVSAKTEYPPGCPTSCSIEAPGEMRRTGEFLPRSTVGDRRRCQVEDGCDSDRQVRSPGLGRWHRSHEWQTRSVVHFEQHRLRVCSELGYQREVPVHLS